MRVAMLDPSLFTIPYDVALCAALREAGCEVRLVGRRLRPGEGSAPPGLEPFFYRMSEGLAGRLPARAWRALKGGEHALDLLRLDHRLARRPPDILHVQWAPLPAVDVRLMARFRRLAPTVLTVHDTTPFNGSPASRLQHMGGGRLFAAFDRLVVHTTAGKARLAEQGVSAHRIAVVPHGLLPSPVSGDAAPRPGGERVVLLFGKIKPYKGLDLLIEALGRLPAALGAGVRLKVVGEPHMPVAPLVARAAELRLAGRIDWDLRYVGEDEVGAIIAGADVLAFPYRDIEASGVLMAALGQGKPVLASSLGVFRELLRDGEHGRLVPPGDIGALAAALADMLADPEGTARMGERVRALAAQVPGWDRIAAATIALYEETLRERRARPAGAPAGLQLRP